jgi:hypothetical protein
VTAAAWEAVITDNETPYLFRFSGLPVRLSHDEGRR